MTTNKKERVREAMSKSLTANPSRQQEINEMLKSRLNTDKRKPEANGTKRGKMNAAPPQKRVLDALRDSILTWDALKGAAKANDESLGFSLGELLNLRKIWTAERNGLRVYGIEKRTGLVPRLAHPQRRSTD